MNIFKKWHDWIEDNVSVSVWIFLVTIMISMIGTIFVRTLYWLWFAAIIYSIYCLVIIIMALTSTFRD